MLSTGKTVAFPSLKAFKNKILVIGLQVIFARRKKLT